MKSLFGVTLDGLARKLIVLFTLIEDIALTIWAVLLYLAFTGLYVGNYWLFAFWFVLAFIELSAGLEVEHTIATVTGKV